MFALLASVCVPFVNFGKVPPILPLPSFTTVRFLMLLLLSSLSTVAAAQDFGWARTFGDSASQWAPALATGPAGNVVCGGMFVGSFDFDPAPGPGDTLYLTSNGYFDTFVTNLDPSGNLLWAVSFGTAGLDQTEAVVVDAQGNVYVTCLFHSTVDFDPGPGTHFLTALNGWDMCLVKLTPTGELDWVRHFEGQGSETCGDMTIDQDGNILLTGQFGNWVDLDPGAGVSTLASAGQRDVFVCKLDPTGNLIWGRSVGGSLEDHGEGIATDSLGNVYVCGYFEYNADFDPGSGTHTLVSAGLKDGFVMKLDSLGDLVWVNQIGGAGVQWPRAIAVDNAGNVDVTGFFGNTVDFDPSASTHNLSAVGNEDSFVLQLDNAGNLGWVKSIGGPVWDNSHDLVVDNAGAIYSTGLYEGTTDFDIGGAGYVLNGTGARESYVVKYAQNGNLEWVYPMVGAGHDGGDAIALGNGGSIYSSGRFRDSLDFDGGPGVHLVAAGGVEDFYIHKILQCDSIAIRDTIAVTACDSYTAPDSSSYTSSGTYVAVIPSVEGCDSTITIYLTVVSSITSTSYDTLYPTVCNSYTAPDGAVYAASGTYAAILPNAIGCDSIITINLTVNDSTSSDTMAAACTSFTWHGSTYIASGTHMDTLNNAAGCDSVVTLHLTISDTSAGDTTVSACDSLNWFGTTYFTSDTVAQLLTNAAGCDSVATWYLGVLSSTSSSINSVACSSYLAPDSAVYTSSGMYQAIIQNTVGCDSVISINLMVGQPYTTALSDTVCDSLMFAGNTLDSSGVYYDTLVSVAGCDSVIALSLIVHHSIATSDTVSDCGPYPFGSNLLDSSGTYIDTFATQYGCDSIATLHLTIPNATETLSVAACDAFELNDSTYTTSGQYVQTLTTALGCDSVLTLDLALAHSTSFSFIDLACTSYTVPSGSATYTASGTYLDTIANAAGCDSVLSISVNISTSTAASISPTACSNYTSPAGNTWTSSGLYTDTIPNAEGCDSIITINLTVDTGSTATISPTACGAYTSPSGALWTVSGTYLDTVQNASGCDSLLTINLTIVSPDTGVAATDSNLTATASGATFQWLSCGNGNTPIAGATNALWTPVVTGSYAVEVTTNGCTDTSACYPIIVVGLAELNAESTVVAYPNPTHNQITLTGVIGSFSYQLTDLTGRVCRTGRSDLPVIDVKDLSTGMYMLSIEQGQQIRLVRIVKD